jgi:hypothetical protein
VILPGNKKEPEYDILGVKHVQKTGSFPSMWEINAIPFGYFYFHVCFLSRSCIPWSFIYTSILQIWYFVKCFLQKK